jgi:hypothetical protein
MPIQTESYNAAKLEPIIHPADARTDIGTLGNSLTLTKGTVLGKKTSDSKLYAYASGNSDGTQTAVAILMYDVVTDSSGNHFLGTSTTINSLNLPTKNTPVYIAGTFSTSDLTGYDATAKTGLGGRITHNGYLRVP